ncbi:GDP-mannose 6-dehydrogenase [Galdieria sulphuraria]|nr:GDP-mannose 6-dehydrogenase [Galdieria sulphuraria]
MSWNGEGRSSKTHQVLNDPKRITLIGVGRLGLCLALVAERAGYKVLGVDVLPQYVEKINDKTLVSSEPFVTEYLKLLQVQVVIDTMMLLKYQEY